MSHKFLLNATFHLLLKKIDEEFANEVYQEGCLYCGSQLHSETLFWNHGERIDVEALATLVA